MLRSAFHRALALPHKIPGYLRVVQQLQPRSAAIVMYHGVVREPLPVFHWSHLSAARFEEQIDFLSKNYAVIPLRELLERLHSKRSLEESCRLPDLR